MIYLPTFSLVTQADLYASCFHVRECHSKRSLQGVLNIPQLAQNINGVIFQVSTLDLFVLNLPNRVAPGMLQIFSCVCRDQNQIICLKDSYQSTSMPVRTPFLRYRETSELETFFFRRSSKRSWTRGNCKSCLMRWKSMCPERPR